jgi:hypothetical protein
MPCSRSGSVRRYSIFNLWFHLALAKAHDSGASPDEDFAQDLKDLIAERWLLDASVWD